MPVHVIALTRGTKAVRPKAQPKRRDLLLYHNPYYTSAITMQTRPTM